MTQQKPIEEFNVDYPRLIHGSSLRNLESIFEEGGLVPKSRRKNGKSAISGTFNGYEGKSDAIYFNVAGVPITQLTDYFRLEQALIRATSEEESGITDARGIAQFRDWVINRAPGLSCSQFREQVIFENENVRVYFGGDSNQQRYLIKNGKIAIVPILEIKYINIQDEKRKKELSDSVVAFGSENTLWSSSGVGIPYNKAVAYMREMVKAHPDMQPAVVYWMEQIPKEVWDRIDAGLRLEIPNTVKGLRNFDGLGYIGPDLYFLIDEKALLNAQAEVIRRAGIEVGDENPAELKRVIQANLDRLENFYAEDLRRYPSYQFKGFTSLVDPRSACGGCGTALNLRHIEELQRMRTRTEYQMEGVKEMDAHCIEGLFTNLAIPLEYINGIVLAPLERKLEEKFIGRSEEPPMFGSTVDAVSYINKLSNRTDRFRRVPVFSMEGKCLYNPL